MLVYSACFSTKMVVAKLARMGKFCLAKSDAVWPVARMATSSTSLDYCIVVQEAHFYVINITVLLLSRRLTLAGSTLLYTPVRMVELLMWQR